LNYCSSIFGFPRKSGARRAADGGIDEARRSTKSPMRDNGRLVSPAKNKILNAGS